MVMEFSGYSYETSTPVHHFYYTDLFVEGLGFLHIVSRDSYSNDIASGIVKVFTRQRIKKYKEMLYVMGAYSDELQVFDSVGLAPPPLAKIYESKSPILSKYAYQVFPMFGIEFLHGFTNEQFWIQRKRSDKWSVSILDWQRRLHKETKT